MTRASFSCLIRPLLKIDVLAWVLVVAWGWACRERVITAGFWFEPVTVESSRLGGSLTPEDMHTIESVAMSEVARAFAGLRIAFSDRRNATYRVRVVQELHDLRFPRQRGGPAGQSHAISGFGGSGAVNFELLASNAIGYAPPTASRADIIAAIGKGVGRAAVHEFAHQLLPSAAIDGTTNVRSYEYGFASRREQYYGELQWDLAWPILQKRVGKLGRNQ